MRYFTIDEFDSPDQPGSGEQMDETFLSMIDEARDLAGVPFKITSGYRTIAHNKKVGGAVKSSHTTGYAADIAAPNSLARYAIIRGAIMAGFNRIGVGRTFVHIDSDPYKPSGVIWHYYKP
jgi:uncharacterized protein YcbK (DUF882 family)